MSWTRVFLLCISIFFGGCAHSPLRDRWKSEDLFAVVCAPLNGVEVRGSIWTKIESEGMNGQFPATVVVNYPQKMLIEVTDLIGSPQASIAIESGRILVRLAPALKPRVPPGALSQSLGGLPMEWASRIFAGGVPCPGEGAPLSAFQHRFEGDEWVLGGVDARTQTPFSFSYAFKSFAGRPWVTRVRWKNSGGEVELVREQPEDQDDAPRKWSASSSRGKIQVRWKDRVPTKPEVRS